MKELPANPVRQLTQNEKCLNCLEKYKLLLDNVEIQIWCLTDAQTYGYANKAHAIFLGLNIDDLEQKNLCDVLSIKEAKVSIGNNLKVIESKKQIQNKEWIQNSQGESRLLSITKTPILDINGEVKYIVCSAHDITEQEQMEEKLRLSEARYRAIIEDQTELICRFRADGTLTFVNEAYCRYFGKRQEDLIGQNFFSLIPPEEHDFVKKKIASLDAENPLITYEHQVIDSNGEIRWQQWTDRVILDPKGNPLEFQSAGRDITELKKAEEALKISEKRLNSILQSLDDVVWSALPTSHTDFKLLYLNPTAEKLFGYPVEDFFSNPRLWLEVVYPKDRSQLQSKISILLKSGSFNREYRIVRSNGEIRWVYERSIVIYDDKGNLSRIDGIITDITERKQIEEVLQKKHNELEMQVQKRTCELAAINHKLKMEILERKRAEISLKQSFENLQQALKGTVNALATVTEKRDPYTAGHQQRVARLACAIAKEMGLSENQIEGIHVAGTLHDIGKIYIPAEILSKPGELNQIENTFIKTHPQIGSDILKTIPFEWPIAEIILQHHERINGSGYPQGLSSEDILLEAKILAVADIVEAMASHRPYRAARSIKEALAEITKNRGILYDPQVVDICLKLFYSKGFTF